MRKKLENVVKSDYYHLFDFVHCCQVVKNYFSELMFFS